VLYADMVGYSRLIGLDDTGTLKRLRRLRKQIIDPAIEEHGGRVVQTGGDSLLMVFDSVDGAVQCAMQVQRQVPYLDSESSPDRAMRFRIGINIGDAIADGTDLHGDAVNVAVRLQAECPPGGICVTRAVRDHVRHRLDLVFEELGALRLKNIDGPVEAFALNPAKAAVATPGTVAPAGGDALQLPDRPSIAVLPFQNMSGDPEQEYFADGMVEEIIIGLSRVRSFFVIARNSSFAYKGKSPDVRQVGRELGVRYVLEGSVRKAGNRVRITGQLIEAMTGAHLWADRFDGGLEDVFDLQDRVTEAVVMAIEPKIRSAEIERALRKPTENLRAYDLVLRALPHMNSHVRERLQKAVQLLRQATAIDPRCALAYAHLARCLAYLVSSNPPDEEPDTADMVRMAKIAIECANEDPDVLAIAGLIIAQAGGDYEGGIALIEKSLSLYPRCVEALTIGGSLYVHSGNNTKAFEYFLRAERVNPLEGSYIRSFGRAFANFVESRYELALQLIDVSLRDNPAYLPTLRLRVVILGLLGKQEDARNAVQQLLLVAPGWTVSRTQAFFTALLRDSTKKQDWLDRLCEGCRRAGLPE
jgi:adenylate cyclase